MTLCKGQGGTPADKPMRAWHDSWQVVSMAANAGLILVRADPFRVEDYETYTSTGFRFGIYHFNKNYNSAKQCSNAAKKQTTIFTSAKLRKNVVFKLYYINRANSVEPYEVAR